MIEGYNGTPLFSPAFEAGFKGWGFFFDRDSFDCWQGQWMGWDNLSDR